MRRAAMLAGALLALIIGWFIAAEAGVPAGGLPRHDAVTKAMRFVDPSTPVTEEGATPGPYLALGWGITDARPWYRMVWAVQLTGTFVGHCAPSEANACFPETTATVVIDYVNGRFVIVRYGT